MRVLVFVYISLSLGLVSCFEKDEVMTPGEWEGQAFAFNESIYDKQFYYSLSENSIKSENSNDAWDLSFDASPSGWLIRINSANLLAVWRTGSSNFDLASYSLANGSWLYDKSDGDPDSTGIGKWVDISNNTYSLQVYLLGKYDGVTYRPFKKVVFAGVTDTSYMLKYADLNGNNMHEVVIKKDTSYNQVYYNFTSHSTMYIEPLKNTWDLIFTQYTTTLYTVEGLPIPYFVRGTLINPYKVEAQVDSIRDFSAVSRDDIIPNAFSSKWDVIGYNWKAVEIDQLSNTAKYKVRQKYFYIIKDVTGTYYKLKFTDFFNESLTPGYPAFIFLKPE